MKYLLYQLARVALWLVQRLPQKPQPSQVRDTQPEPAPVTVTPYESEFIEICRTPRGIDAISVHLDRHDRIMDGYGRLEAADRYRKAQSWNQVAIPRHRRDLELINELKRLGKI